MPAALHVDREAVRVLAIAVGVREAARQLGLNENRVIQWSHRFNWLKKAGPPIQQPPTVTKNDVIAVINPADALANQLADDSYKTRIGLSTAARNAAKTFENMPGTGVITKSKALRDITAAASTLHGWEERKEGGLNLNIGVVIGGMGE